jgi:hypothetical protein
MKFAVCRLEKVESVDRKAKNNDMNSALSEADYQASQEGKGAHDDSCHGDLLGYIMSMY